MAQLSFEKRLKHDPLAPPIPGNVKLFCEQQGKLPPAVLIKNVHGDYGAFNSRCYCNVVFPSGPQQADNSTRLRIPVEPCAHCPQVVAVNRLRESCDGRVHLDRRPNHHYDDSSFVIVFNINRMLMNFNVPSRLPTYRPTDLLTYLLTYLPTHLPTLPTLPTYLPTYQPTHLPTYLLTYRPT